MQEPHSGQIAKITSPTQVLKIMHALVTYLNQTPIFV